MRSKIVSREHLNKIGSELGLMQLMKSNLELSRFGENTRGNLWRQLLGRYF